MENFDVMVIGTGSGLDVAAHAAEHGVSVAIVEQGPFGGTCLNRGCIPSKMLIHCADVMETIKRAHLFGIKASVEAVDWQFIVHRANDEVDAEAAQIEEANRKFPGIAVYKGTGRFVGKKTLEVNGERIRAKTVIIAAGTRPSAPPIPGLDRVPYMTSDQALRLDRQPKHLAIMGGGYIAAELAHFYGTLGTKVTIIYRGSTLLRREDEQIAQRFTEVYRRKFDLVLNAQVSKVSQHGEETYVDVSVDGDDRTVVADALLIATGRVPNTDTLDVAKAGVAVDARGFVKTDKYLQTNVPGIWALGDVVGRYMLKHNANMEAAYVAHNAFHPDNREEVDYHAMPHAIFASPQVAGVGMTEQEARVQKVHYVAATYDYKDTAYGSSIEDMDGFVKVLAGHEKGEILGCHIIGTHASALIQEPANAMHARLSVDAIRESIYVHPALPEVVHRAFSSLAI